jgi:hypothetical protein
LSDDRFASLNSTQDSTGQNFQQNRAANTSSDKGGCCFNSYPETNIKQGNDFNSITSLIEQNILENCYLNAMKSLQQKRNILKAVNSIDMRDILSIFHEPNKTKDKSEKCKMNEKLYKRKFSNEKIFKNEKTNVEIDFTNKEVKVEKKSLKNNALIKQEVTVYFGKKKKVEKKYCKLKTVSKIN